MTGRAFEQNGTDLADIRGYVGVYRGTPAAA